MGNKSNVIDLKPSRQRVRALSPEEMDDINGIVGGFVEKYGLRLMRIDKEALEPVATHPEAKAGFLQKELRYPLTLLHGVGAAAVVASGLGLGKNDHNKRMVDRSAAGVQGYGLNSILSCFDNRVAVVSASEGERIKPGEKGGNPARFRGQIFGHDKLRKNISRIFEDEYKKDVQFIYVVTDDVDGTGKATESIHSSVTASVYTQSRVMPLPDEYMTKVVSRKTLPPEITAGSSSKDIVDALSKVHGVPRSKLNLFSLIRPRHNKPVDEILALGPDFIMDNDGDVMPAIASAIGEYFFPNGYPLHGIAGNIGGAAEAGLLIPVVWRGGSVLLEFASKSGLKSRDWDDRRRFSEKEVETIEEFGFDPCQSFRIEDIYENYLEDGIAVFGAITDNYHVEAFPSGNKGLPGVDLGEDFIRTHSLQISSNGRAEILHAVFDYAESREHALSMLTPYMTTLLEIENLKDLERSMDDMLKQNELRLKTEFMQEYYLAIDVHDDCIRFNDDVYHYLRKSGKNHRFTYRDDVIIETLRNKQPDWFSA